MISEWGALWAQEKEKIYFKNLMNYVDQQRRNYQVYPLEQDVFKAFEITPYEKVKVVILGQDPYHQPHQAMGLSFSVSPGCPLPKSLINIYKELSHDLGINRMSGDLTQWAMQGVFLLNTILTVRKGEPLSHRNQGWEIFTDEVILKLNQRKTPVIFVLWGQSAQEKLKMIAEHHACICSPHPSPLSAYRGFFGSRPFSRINEQLVEWGQTPIDWSLE